MKSDDLPKVVTIIRNGISKNGFCRELDWFACEIVVEILAFDILSLLFRPFFICSLNKLYHTLSLTSAKYKTYKR